MKIVIKHRLTVERDSKMKSNSKNISVKKDGKDKETIQLITTPDSNKNTINITNMN